MKTERISRESSRQPAQLKGGSALIGLMVAVAGCAETPPAESVATASETYETAEDGRAQEYAPDELLEARQLLDQAQDAKNGSEAQEHYAYLADRQARIASSSGTIEYYQEQQKKAQAEYIARVEDDRTNARESLEETREALRDVVGNLQRKDANVEELQKKKQELEEREAKLAAELDETEEARKDAEQRAQAALASLEELANVKEEANQTVITLSGSVLFKTGESSLLPIAKNRLSKVAEALKVMEDEKKFVIEGHTDSRGAKEMNQDLSKKRAQSVREYLVSEGVDSSRIDAVGKGESDPIATNDTPEGRANNRRVEVHITDTKDATAQKDSSSKQGATASN